MAEDGGYPYDLFVSFAEEDRGWVKGYLLRELDLDEKRILTKDEPLGRHRSKL